MSNTLNLIDSDAHVIEPRDMFERYLETKVPSTAAGGVGGLSGRPAGLGF